MFHGTERFAWQQPAPEGFHEVTAVRKGLLISGASVFGALYLYSVITAATASLPWLYVPVLGPIVVGAQAVSSNSGGGLPFFSTFFGVSFIVVGGLEAAAATVAVLGVALPTKWLERSGPGLSIRLTPTPTGVLLSGAF
jgi:hypothetical protein